MCNLTIDNRKAANDWIETLSGLAEQLKSFPRSARIVAELNEATIGELLLGNGPIVYRIEMNHISILTVRNIRQILTESEIKSK